MNNTLSRWGLLFLCLLFVFPCSSQTILNVENKKAGKLSKVIKKKNMASIISLKIDGFINADDVIYLHSFPNLKNLDLTDATKQDSKEKKPSVLSGIAGKFIGTNLVNKKTSNKFREADFISNTDHYFTKSTSPGAFMNYIYGERNRKELDTLTILNDSELRNPIVSYFDPCFIKIKSSNILVLNRYPEQLQNLYGVTLISIGAFANNKSIHEVTIPSSVSIIPDYCFYGCTSLNSVKIEGAVTSIGKNAFAKTNVRNITLPASVKKIWLDSFGKCDMKLLSSIPPSIQTEQETTYKDKDDNLKNWNVEIPTGTFKKYHEDEMWNRTILKESGARNKYTITMDTPGLLMLKIPMSAWNAIDTLIIKGFLYDTDMAIIRKMNSLKYIDISNTYLSESPETKAERKRHEEELNAVAKLIGASGEMAYRDGKISTQSYLLAKSISELAVPASEIKEADENCIIPPYCFSGLKYLETVKMPLRAISIGNNAFSGCINLRNVEFPLYVKTIGSEAFSDCTKLRISFIPKSITKIGNNAFKKGFHFMK